MKGWKEVADDEHQGLPLTLKMEEAIEMISEIVWKDQHLIFQMLVEVANMDKEMLR
jgi:hypothetical protein